MEKSATLREVEFHFPSALLHAGELSHFASAGLSFEPRSGMLKGFMDLIFHHEGHYYLLDWKTNFLGSSTSDYTQAAMEAEMLRKRYHLQWKLYAVALRKWLRLKTGNDRALGGALYVFMRGVSPENKDWGILHCKPDFAELDAMEALFNAEK